MFSEYSIHFPDIEVAYSTISWNKICHWHLDTDLSCVAWVSCHWMINTSLIFISSDGIIYSTGNAFVWKLLTCLKQGAITNALVFLSTCWCACVCVLQTAVHTMNVCEFGKHYSLVIQNKLKLSSVTDAHCLFNQGLSRSACRCMWMCTRSMHVVFPGLYVCMQRFYTHKAHLAIYHCLSSSQAADVPTLS